MNFKELGIPEGVPFMAYKKGDKSGVYVGYLLAENGVVLHHTGEIKGPQPRDVTAHVTHMAKMRFGEFKKIVFVPPEPMTLREILDTCGVRGLLKAHLRSLVTEHIFTATSVGNDYMVTRVGTRSGIYISEVEGMWEFCKS